MIMAFGLEPRLSIIVICKKIFPSMRSVGVLGKGTTNWQLIPEEADDFESEVLLLCEMARKGDRRIGHVPKQKKSKN